jgi:hypothetical protein
LIWISSDKLADHIMRLGVLQVDVIRKVQADSVGPAKIVRQLGVARSIVYRNKASDEQRVNDCKVPQVLRDPPGYRACRPGTLPLAHALPEVWRPDQDGQPCARGHSGRTIS